MKKTEITVQVFNSLEEIDKILNSYGYKQTETYQLNDWYFTKLQDVSNVKYLDLMNSSFLVRQVLGTNEEVKIVYKKKEVDGLGNVISEEKIQSYVNSLQKTIDIFKACGLNNYCVVKNTTYSYKKDEIAFDVQVIENLGIFIECEEFEKIKDLTEKQKIEYLTNFVKSLNLNIGTDYSCKKVLMLLKR